MCDANFPRYKFLLGGSPCCSVTFLSSFCHITGNGGSLEKCRRRWDLCDADFLRYKFLCAFDRAMCHLDKAFGFMSAPHQWVSRKVRDKSK
jgi:hypothetical protein